jgi:hypothetical protein
MPLRNLIGAPTRSGCRRHAIAIAIARIKLPVINYQLTLTYDSVNHNH